MFRNICALLLLFLFCLPGCKNESRFQMDPSDSDQQIHTHRFDQALNDLDTTRLEEEVLKLGALYPAYYKLYCQNIIRVGLPKDKKHIYFLSHFLSDTVYREVYDTVQVHFTDLNVIEEDLLDGLKRFHLLFPEKALPEVYYHISGFNEAIAVAEDILSISLENYLGENHPFYEWLGIYQYKKVQKVPERISRDALLGWITTEFENASKSNQLIDEMIYQGKLIFLLQQLLPETPTHLLLGLTSAHYKWCESNESKIWTAMIEWKHLFSKDKLTIKKHLDEAPFNNFFGEGSAPKSGIYIGWRIVSEYMKTNKNISLSDLFEEQSGQVVLQMSEYRP